MGKKRAPHGWWDNIEHCKETAAKYSSLQDLRKYDKGCYTAIYKYHWQTECCSHIDYRVREYTREQLEEIAQKYKTYAEFRENDLGAYLGAKARGILEDICSHMPPLRINTQYDFVPTFEICAEVAKKYDTRTAFEHSEDRRFHWYAQKHGWLDAICRHMRVVGNAKRRCIYGAFFDKTHTVYIGLTCDVKRRWQDHMSDIKSAVNIYAKQTGYTPRFEQLTDYIDKEEASKQEGVYLKKYQDDGWNTLNRSKTGTLGSAEGGYTKEEVLEAAAKFTSLREFREKDSGHYEAGYRGDYWGEVRAVCKPKYRIFTDDELKEIAADCQTLAEFRKKDAAALTSARNRGILDKICAHMNRTKEKHPQRFSDDELKETTGRYTSLKQFKNECPKMYGQLKRSDRLEDFCSHMNNDFIYWTYDRIKEEALKYQYRSDFQRGSKSAYQRAMETKILDDVCSHMKPKPKELGYKCDNIEDAKKIAATCNGRSELSAKYVVAYKMLKSANLLDEVIPRVYNKWNLKWTKDKRAEVAKLCSSRKDFKEKFPQAFDVARVNGELDEICSHMPFHRHKWTIEEMTEICSHCHNFKELKDYNYELWHHAVKKSKERRDLIKSLCNKKDEQ